MAIFEEKPFIALLSPVSNKKTSPLGAGG